MSRKRSRAAIGRAAEELEGRMEWLESAWGVKTQYEVDLSTGAAWVKIVMPGNATALVVRCDVFSITLPGSGETPDRGNDHPPSSETQTN